MTSREVTSQMGTYRGQGSLPAVTRMPTGVPGLDEVLGGGLPAGRTCIIAGPPGSGKTTLGNHLAFAHAASGGSVVVATLLTEPHELMLQNIRDFGFYRSDLPGDRIKYLNLLQPLQDNGLEGVMRSIRHEVRAASATLLIIDGAAVVEDLFIPNLDLREFVQDLETHAAGLGCTMVILTGHTSQSLRPLAAHVNGVILLSSERIGFRHARTLEISKLRGGPHATGTHEFAIGQEGIGIYPRLESLTGRVRPPERAAERLSTGVSGLDAMIGGGLLPLSTTMVMGSPGAGKTVLGLSFLAEGANRGERGLIVGFHEPPAGIISTAEGIGLDFARHVDEGRIRILWTPPVELSVDAWAWEVLSVIDAYKPERVLIDGIADIQRHMTSQHRLTSYVSALINELRARGTTALYTAEIESYVDNQVAAPIPAVSATMDNGILLRQIELDSEIRRLVSALKARQVKTDPSIREFTIREDGIHIGERFAEASRLLTGAPTIPPHSSGGENIGSGQEEG